MEVAATIKHDAVTAPGQRGFTVLELMITLVIGAVIMTLAVPSYRDFTMNNRRADVINEFVNTLRYARSEALNRRTLVFVCKTADSTAATPACSTATTGYETGWLVIADTNTSTSNAKPDGTADPSTGDLVLRRGPKSNTGITLKGNTNLQNVIVFNSLGTVGKSGSPSNGTIVFCDTRPIVSGNAASPARRIVISRGGSIQTDSDGSQATTCSP